MSKNDRRMGGVQVGNVVQQMNQALGLPLKEVLAAEHLNEVIDKHLPNHRQSGYRPLVTLWAFLSQMLSPDKSCQSAVARINADRITQGEEPLSANTGGYCKSRNRLPEPLLEQLLEESRPPLPGGNLSLWKGHCVKIADGTTLSCADTAENEAAYGRGPNQRMGVGFPILRLVGLFCLWSGSLLGQAHGPYRGKQTGEHALLRRLLHLLNPGDVLLGDAYYASFF